jgi:hypothetical protein
MASEHPESSEQASWRSAGLAVGSTAETLRQGNLGRRTTRATNDDTGHPVHLAKFATFGVFVAPN